MGSNGLVADFDRGFFGNDYRDQSRDQTERYRKAG
jgi:hypothetical protein